jgi:hypothetical protein
MISTSALSAGFSFFSYYQIVILFSNIVPLIMELTQNQQKGGSAATIIDIKDAAYRWIGTFGSYYISTLRGRWQGDNKNL